MAWRPLIRILIVLALAVGLAACGGGDDGGEPAAEGTTPAAEGTMLELEADPGGAFAFDKDSLEAPAGTITIHLANPASVPHNVAIEGNGVDEISETVTNADTSLTVDLEPGEYTFYCDIAGHREGGMEGTLTVS
jgi:plastocyanin